MLRITVACTVLSLVASSVDPSRVFQDYCADNTGPWANHGCFISLSGARPCKCKAYQTCKNAGAVFMPQHNLSVRFSPSVGECGCCSGWLTLLIVGVVLISVFACIAFCCFFIPCEYAWTSQDAAPSIRELLSRSGPMYKYKRPVLGRPVYPTMFDDAAIAAGGHIAPPGIVRFVPLPEPNPAAPGDPAPLNPVPAADVANPHAAARGGPTFPPTSTRRMSHPAVPGGSTDAMRSRDMVRRGPPNVSNRPPPPSLLHTSAVLQQSTESIGLSNFV